MSRFIQRLVASLALSTLIFLAPHAAAEAPTTPRVSVEQQHVALLADAIYNTEGRCTPGQSGEYGCYQYLPATWQSYSKEVEGAVIPQTAQNERQVTEGMITKWVDSGMSDRGVFLMWNQGSAVGWGPAGTDCYKGVNDYGVPYNSCSYAQRALQYVADHENNQ